MVAAFGTQPAAAPASDKERVLEAYKAQRKKRKEATRKGQGASRRKKD